MSCANQEIPRLLKFLKHNKSRYALKLVQWRITKEQVPIMERLASLYDINSIAQLLAEIRKRNGYFKVFYRETDLIQMQSSR